MAIFAASGTLNKHPACKGYASHSASTCFQLSAGDFSYIQYMLHVTY